METQRQLGYPNNFGPFELRPFEHLSTAQILDFITQKQKGRLFVRDPEVQAACVELRRRPPTRRYSPEEFKVAIKQPGFWQQGPECDR